MFARLSQEQKQVSEEKARYRPTNCRRVKFDIDKDWYWKKKPAKDGGGQVPQVKIKRTETYECDVADLEKNVIVKEINDKPKKSIKITIRKKPESMSQEKQRGSNEP